ncbi:hypothetical protein PGIGA_G00107440 [Pangasianodon gigas]|uniref:Uncharacterized protein n=1 Tax=Pangasianodon gigas TaxID=30993 RepID=A0ACC5W8G4_PANGG|nr:hypothetical protein [Pangasianodon gigas]
MTVNLQCMSLDWGRKLECPEGTPEAQREHAGSVHAGRRQDLNPQPRRLGSGFSGLPSSRSSVQRPLAVLLLPLLSLRAVAKRLRCTAMDVI